MGMSFHNVQPRRNQLREPFLCCGPPRAHSTRSRPATPRPPLTASGEACARRAANGGLLGRRSNVTDHGAATIGCPRQLRLTSLLPDIASFVVLRIGVGPNLVPPFVGGRLMRQAFRQSQRAVAPSLHAVRQELDSSSSSSSPPRNFGRRADQQLTIPKVFQQPIDTR